MQNVNSKNKNYRSSGQAVVMLLLFTMIAISVTTAGIIAISLNSQATDKLYSGTTAYDISESGAETAMIKLLRDPTYAGETLTIGAGQAVVTVTGTNPKTIVSVGTLGTHTRKIQVTADYTNYVLTATSWKEIF